MINKQNNALNVDEMLALVATQNEIIMAKDEVIEDNKKTISQLESKLDQYEKMYDQLMEQIRLSKSKRFAPSTEQSDFIQLNLFDEVELNLEMEELQEVLEDKQKESNTDTNKQEETTKKMVRKPSSMNPQLEVIEIIHEPKDTEGYERIGEESKETIRYQPAKWYIERHIYPTYKKEDEYGIDFLQEDKIKSCIANSYASAEVIAFLIYLKFMMGMPLYRLEKDLRKKNVNISRQTMSNWFMSVSENVLALFVERLKVQLLKMDIIHADETTVKVLKHQDGSENLKSYMWVYCSSSYDRPICIYEYQPNRKAEHPQTFLEGYHGYLLTDGYPGYNKIDVTRVGCLAHARRKFVDAITGMSEKDTVGRTIAEQVIRQMNYIFSIEKKTKMLSLEKKQEVRKAKMKPAFEQLKTLLLEGEQILISQGNLGKAITYTLNQFSSFENILLDARIEPSNNRAERMVKPFVIGRKAWLFSGTTRGANTSATLYTIVQTAALNNLHVEKYLAYVLNEMTTLQISSEDSIDHLLPTSDTLPQELYTKKNRTGI